jgi:hypothetical protein
MGKTDRIKALEKEIEDLRAQWPAHSVPPTMLMQLEDLEDELENWLSEEADSAIQLPISPDGLGES